MVLSTGRNYRELKTFREIHDISGIIFDLFWTSILYICYLKISTEFSDLIIYIVKCIDKFSQVNDCG